MRIFVTGVNGQLGHDVMNELIRRGHEGIGSDLTPAYDGIADRSYVSKAQFVSLDITDADAVQAAILAVNPDAVIHCAAWTAVDQAEDAVGQAWAVNADGTRNVADACRMLDCTMTYLSTDYVFDGSGTDPWQEDCRAFDPVNVYGRTKLEGENAIREMLKRYYIVRTAWVFGMSGNNFVKTMLKIGRVNDTVRVVNDQIGTPTYTIDLARLLIDMNETDRFGVYHATNEGGYISWYDFACEIFRQANYPVKVTPVTTAEYGLSKARRPFNSRLGKSGLIENGFVPLPPWQDALTRYLKELGGELWDKSK